MTSTPDFKASKPSEEDVSFTLKVFSIATFKTLGEIYSSKKGNPFIFLAKEILAYGESNKLDANHSLLLDSLVARLNKAFERAAKSVLANKAASVGTGEVFARQLLQSVDENKIDFFMSVVTTVVKQIADHVEVINNRIISVRLGNFDSNSDDDQTGFQDRHQVTVGFTFGDKKWVIETFDSNPNLRAVVHVNGVANPKFDEAERLLYSLLTSVSLYISIEKAIYLENEVETKNPVILSKAKMMADILGGDFRNYLSSALELHAASRPSNGSDAVSDKSLAEIIQDEHKCTLNEAAQVVMIFTQKPKYH